MKKKRFWFNFTVIEIENEKKIQIVVFETHCKMSSVYMHLKKRKEIALFLLRNKIALTIA